MWKLASQSSVAFSGMWPSILSHGISKSQFYQPKVGLAPIDHVWVQEYCWAFVPNPSYLLRAGCKVQACVFTTISLLGVLYVSESCDADQFKFNYQGSWKMCSPEIYRSSVQLCRHWAISAARKTFCHVKAFLQIKQHYNKKAAWIKLLVS